MKRSTKVSLVAAILVLFTAGVAVAAWMVSGTGEGKGKAAYATDLTVAPGTMPVADLYPGSKGGDLTVSVTNDNAFPVQVSGVTVGATTIAPSECAVTLNTGQPFQFSSSLAKIAKGETAQVTITDALSMGSGAATACQGADIAVSNVTVQAQSTP